LHHRDVKKDPFGTLGALCEVLSPAGQKPSPEPLQSSPRRDSTRIASGEQGGKDDNSDTFAFHGTELLGIPEISSPELQPVPCKEALDSKTC